MPGLGAGAVQLFLQLGDFSALDFGALAQVVKLVVGHTAVQRHRTGGGHHLLQHGGDFLKGVGLADQVGAACHGALVGGAGRRDFGQPFDEGGQHVLHLLLRFHGARLGLGLLEDHVLEPALHIVQAAQSERRGGCCHQRLGLAVQPAVFHAEHGDVLEHHVQQLQQAGADGGLVFGGKRQPVGEVPQHELDGGDGRCGLFQKGDELLRHLDHAGIVFAQRGQRVVDQAGEHLRKLVRQDAGVAGGGGACSRLYRGRRRRAQPQVGVADQHTL